jgi:acetylornithine/succinyldiaminopimelate/putrescine aminotransferase
MNVLGGFKELKAEIEETLKLHNKRIDKLMIALRRDSVYSELSLAEEAAAEAIRVIHREKLLNTQTQVIMLNNHLNRINANIETLMADKRKRQKIRKIRI